MGLTETAAQILSNPTTGGKHGSAGKAYGNEVRIIDDHGKYLSAGESGELVIKGDNVLLEYFKNEEATSGAFNDDGYFLTGDLGVEDEDGFFFITGRKKSSLSRVVKIFHQEKLTIRSISMMLCSRHALLESKMIIMVRRYRLVYTLRMISPLMKRSC